MTDQQFCKHCEKWLHRDRFQPRRRQCMDCNNAARRKATKANARRRQYYRDYQAKMRTARIHLPGLLEVSAALINGDTDRATRLAKHVYAKALKDGIA